MINEQPKIVSANREQEFQKMIKIVEAAVT